MRQLRFLPFLLMIWICSIQSAQAGYTGEILLWNINPSGGVTEEDALLITSLVAGEIAAHGYQVVTQDTVLQTLRLQEQRQQCGDDVSCMAEIGNALGLGEAVFGKIGRLGVTWVLSLQRVDVRRVKVKYHSNRSIKGEIDELLPLIPAMTVELFPDKKDSKVATGTLVVQGMPAKATVYINDKKQGQAPVTVELKPGIKKIRVEHKGYKPWKGTVAVSRGDKQKQTFSLQRLKPGQLSMTIYPQDATVHIDGEPIEASKGRIKSKLFPGRHAVLTKCKGYETDDRSITIDEGKTTTLNLRLERFYPMNPYKKWGYASFFTGAGLVALGGIATWQAKVAADDIESNGDWDAESRNRAWTGMAITGYVLGGTAMISGVVLWALSPGDKQWWENHQASVGPTKNGDGVAATIGWRW